MNNAQKTNDLLSARTTERLTSRWVAIHERLIAVAMTNYENFCVTFDDIFGVHHFLYEPLD